MKKKSCKLVFLVSLIYFLLISCTLKNPEASVVPSEKQCVSDADCVPAQCCHSTDTVNKDFAPDCSKTFCTMECAPGTLDCGQGEVKCVKKQCKAIL